MSWAEWVEVAVCDGSIYKARNIYTDQKAALKLQLVDHECPTNRYERTFYPKLQGGTGMPILYGDGVQGRYDYLVIDLLGASLDSMYRQSTKKVMDLRSVCCIAMQVIRRLETMHNRGVLHRDIQLGNCVIGQPPNEKLIYMIDFGFSKIYMDPRTGQHIPDSKRKRDFIGNYWFSSVSVHCKGRGDENITQLVPSRRDDMEALALMLIHLLTPGGLSWTRNGVPKTEEAHEILKREKSNARPEDLCRGLPAEFEDFLRYCRRLKFFDCPDYDEWYERFQQLTLDEGFPVSDDFIWPPPHPVRYAHAHARPRAAKVNLDINQLMQDLVRMDIKDRLALGRRDNNVPQAVPTKPNRPPKKVASSSDDRVVYDISSGDESEGQKKGVMRLAKATQLTQLTRRARDSRDNIALARVIREFVELLDSSRSRILTKEGFSFLDSLYKQFADPSVYVVPIRSSRRQHLSSQSENIPEGVARKEKTMKMLALRRDVLKAKSNKDLAKLILDFGAIIDKSKSRSITKDSIAFLESIADRVCLLS
ncbi:kinase-like protein [Irpex rosettiformis]|uniref:Kinase-like protein n=1 Tax=Irpex rosettiformis TaxID=378272 RepID=A0ACB8U0M4_9APHY|nr:kinase-like protein [Irpex rosettiformis]